MLISCRRKMESSINAFPFSLPTSAKVTIAQIRKIYIIPFISSRTAISTPKHCLKGTTQCGNNRMRLPVMIYLINKFLPQEKPVNALQPR